MASARYPRYGQAAMPNPQWHPERLAARMPFLRERARIIAATRAFFTARGCMEVETPCLVPSPGAEVHLRAFQTEFVPHFGAGEARRLYLRTSPELAIKRLLAGGVGACFELARVWRNGEESDRHAAEFTMLEWYRPGMDMHSLMDETEAYLRAVWPACPPAPVARITMQQAFARWVGIDLLGTIRADGTGDAAAIGACGDETWEDAFFRLLAERVEPAITPAPTFLTHWPAPQAALARRDPAEPRAALRFELYAGGLELANAFEELTDAAEQRARFAADMAERARLYADPWPVDEDFLAALEHGMPAASGIALGFDRLLMLATGARDVGLVRWL
ncbi:MAG: EF-P lysine aminoacylase EpmA [Alphaproteobacteria bacterium]|jgi:lysyl-tRNA synthetase class 2|nr:EF-P lysine aminoacylase EpmA [Alphaproteobacteria bacterium]